MADTPKLYADDSGVNQTGARNRAQVQLIDLPRRYEGG